VAAASREGPSQQRGGQLTVVLVVQRLLLRVRPAPPDGHHSAEKGGLHGHLDAQGLPRTHGRAGEPSGRKAEVGGEQQMCTCGPSGQIPDVRRG